MAGQYLMERAGERMNVSPDKLAEYLSDGWNVLKTPEENKAVVVDQAVVEIPDSPPLDDLVEPDPEPKPMAEVVEKTGKKSRKAKA